MFEVGAVLIRPILVSLMCAVAGPAAGIGLFLLFRFG
jgi:hypothetical protein